jgi:K+-sensing histidine kinase KdpD
LKLRNLETLIPVTIVPVKARWPQHLLRYAACLVATELVVQIDRRLTHVNPTTVALTFLLMVLWVAAYWGFRFSVFLAIIATLAFNYYFLPPIGTFTVADPQNWVALFAFLVTAATAPADRLPTPISAAATWNASTPSASACSLPTTLLNY